MTSSARSLCFGPGAAPLVVVGAGCCGLAVGLQLLQAGHKDVVILAKDITPHTVSDQAGALWRPFGEVSAANEPLFREWGASTFQFLNQLRLKHGSNATGILLVSGFEVFSAPRAAPFWAKDVLNFRTIDSQAEMEALGIKGKKGGWSYTSFVVEMNKYLAFLHREFFRLGGRLHLCTLPSLSAVHALVPNASLVVNCAGLGSAALVGDSGVFPVAGHILRMSVPALQHFYMDEESTTYIFPRSVDAIVGGTYLKHDAGTQPSIQNKIDILTRAAGLAPEIAEPSSQVLGEYVGLRPYREVTRLELDLPESHPRAPALAKARKAAAAASASAAASSDSHAAAPPAVLDPAVRCPVIHNYGHGGSGVTLHWGCGVTVMHIIEQQLGIKAPKGSGGKGNVATSKL